MSDMKLLFFCLLLNTSVFGMLKGAQLVMLKIHQEGDRTVRFSFVYKQREEFITAGCTVFYDPGASSAPLPDVSGLINIQENYFKPPCPKELLRRSGGSSTTVGLLDGDDDGEYVDVGE